MRIGQNPSKEQPVPELKQFHQVVLPVYIPNLEGYYQESLEVLQFCLNSLIKTGHSNTFITVVNNGSCKKVEAYLNSLYEMGQIHELIHAVNIGKLNAIFKGICGNRFAYITIADADTLFLSHWQEETYTVFNTFPKAGAVGLTPQFKTFMSNSANVLFDNFFSKSLKFLDVVNPQAMQWFYKSIGWKDDYNKNYLKKGLAISSNDVSAWVGSGHYVATYRGDIFKTLPGFLDAKLGRNTEQYLDKLPLCFGLWRLTTMDNYAYHMGNAPEHWMNEIIKKQLPSLNTDTREITNVSVKKIGRFRYIFIHKLFFKLFKFPFFYKQFLKRKGLTEDMINDY